MMRKEGAVPSAPVQPVPEAAVSSASQSSPVNPTVEPTVKPQPPVHGLPASPASGLVLNERYIIENELGRGGMSRVFAGRDVKLGRRVAIKFLAPGIHDDDELRRFEQEARAAGSLNHPNVLTVHDIGMHQGNPYIVSELLEGGTLRQHLEGTPFALSKAVDYAAQLADGLAAAHDRGIVHRDLKPENLFLTHDGRLKILDFGIAKLVAPEGESPGLRQPAQTQTGAILGTMGYMSPEQVRGQHADCRSDIFSAGAILYEMLSGKRAFKAGSLVETAYAILNDNPPELPEQVPENLQEVVWRCLEKNPEERFQSARELAFQLQKPSGAPSAGSEPHSPRQARKMTPQVVAPARSELQSKGVARRWLRWAFAVAGAAALSVALLLALNVGGWRERLLSSTRPASEGAVPPLVPIKIRRSVAVLGFKNAGQPEQAWLSTALSEMLTTELAAGEKLRTIPEENVARMKVELALNYAETLAKESLVRVWKNLGADLVVLGSYVHLGKEAGGQMRLDVRLQDAVVGETIATFAETGTEKNLFDLVSRAGVKLRKKLGIGEISRAQAAVVRASLPTDPGAARLYSEGLAKLRVFDALGARDLLEQAVAADPNHALAHAALSAAWSGLGYDAKAKDEAKKAFDLSVTLSREDRLRVEGRYRETTREWSKAVDIYRTLWDFFPDNVDYGVRLARAQVSAGKGRDALATVEALLKLPPPGRDDPQIDTAEARAAHSLGDFKREQEAAARAVVKGKAGEATLLVANGLILEGSASFELGEPQRARTAFEESQRIYGAAGDRAGMARALNAIAVVSSRQGDLSGAKAAYEQALAAFREVGSRPDEALALNNIAGVLSRQGDLDGAKRMHEQALAIHRELDDKSGMAMSLHNIGITLFMVGNREEAKRRWKEALAIAREIEDRPKISSALYHLAWVLLEQGDLAEPEALSNRCWPVGARRRTRRG